MSNKWFRQFDNVLIIAPRYPEMSGGARYVENIGTALAEHVRVSVCSIFPGEGAALLPTAVIFEDEFLHRYPIRNLYPEQSILGKLGPWVRKRWSLHSARRIGGKIFGGLNQRSLVVITHAQAMAAVRRVGFDPATCPAVVIGQHHSDYHSLMHESGLEEMLCQQMGGVDAFSVLSYVDAEFFEGLVGVPSFALANPLPLEFQTHARPALPRKEVVALARYSAEKRLPLMVELFAGALARGGMDDWTLRLYGEGSERSKILEMAEQLAVGASVNVGDRVDGVQSVLSGARVNLLTSAYEGFGMSILEAAALGVPTVAFDVSPGLGELMRAVGGLLIPEGDAEGFISALRTLALDDAVHARQAEAARRGATQYSPSMVLDAWSPMIACARRRRDERLKIG